MTGKYTPNHGITDHRGALSGEKWRDHNHFDSHLPPSSLNELRKTETTIAEALRDVGYRTFFAGKWHLGEDGSWPSDHGFDLEVGIGDRAGGRYFAPWKVKKIEQGADGDSLPIKLATETARFIGDNKDQPFFAFLSFYSVHSPIQTTRDLFEKSRKKSIRLDQKGDRFAWDRRLNVRQVQDNPIYGGMIQTMDEAVGIVMQQLDDLNIADNTILVFISDNGGVSSGDNYSTSNLPLRGGKGRQWEGGIRVLLYMRVPGVTEPRSICTTPVNGVDFYPTFLNLTDTDLTGSHSVDGANLSGLLKGETIEERHLFWHYPHYGNQGGEPSSIIMQGDWKLIYYHEDGHNELYNIYNDPGEQDDQAAKETIVAKEMSEKLKRWLNETGAELPVADETFNASKRSSRWDNIQTAQKKKLEAIHASYLSSTYKPNSDWWGSSRPTRSRKYVWLSLSAVLSLGVVILLAQRLRNHCIKKT